MRTDRGFSRLVGFSDGVVAIAITLLILPLVTSATETDTDFVTFLTANAFPLFAFVLSFAVIGRFWLVHHQMYENAVTYNTPLLWANLLWLLTIVFLPFPTELITSSSEEPLTHGLYVGTMVLTSAAALLQQWIVVRNPQLQAEEVRGTLRLLPYVSILVIMLIALVISVLIPGVGLLSLLLLALAAPVERLIDRLRKRTA
jgi:uncharacterized membrane protein